MILNKKTIIDYENYSIDFFGNVYGKKGILKWQDNSNGYKKICLWKNGISVNRYIHRLVAEYFIPNPNKYKYVDHIDRDKENNNHTNLRWCTAKENTSNVAGSKRYSVERSGHKHLSREQKQFIYNLYKSGMTVMEISRKLNITRQTISRYKTEEFIK